MYSVLPNVDNSNNVLTIPIENMSLPDGLFNGAFPSVVIKTEPLEINAVFQDRTLEKEHPTQKKKKRFSNFQFPISHSIYNSPCPTLHSTFPFPTPSPIPQSHSPVPFPTPIPHSPFSLLVTSFFVKGT